MPAPKLYEFVATFTLGELFNEIGDVWDWAEYRARTLEIIKRGHYMTNGVYGLVSADLKTNSITVRFTFNIEDEDGELAA